MFHLADISNSAKPFEICKQWTEDLYLEFFKQGDLEKEKALKDFVRRVEVFSVKLNVHPSNVYLSNAKSRWGSCNSKKEIRLNWRLIQAPPHIINYVICHELAHLKEMNHSNRFWEEVEKVLPEYRSSEKELKTLSSDLYLIG